MSQDTKPRTTAIPWSSESHALTRHLLTTLNEHLDIRLSLWPRPGDPIVQALRLSKLSASMQLAQFVFTDVANPKRLSSKSKAIRGKLLHMRRAYIQLRELEADIKPGGAGWDRFLEKKAQMEPYWDILCTINGDSTDNPEFTDDAVSEIEILQPPFNSSRAVASKPGLGPLLASAAVFASELSKGKVNRDNSDNNGGGSADNGFDSSEEDQVEGVETREETPGSNNLRGEELGQEELKHRSKEAANIERRGQEGENLDLYMVMGSNLGRVPSINRSSLRSARKAGKRIEMHLETQDIPRTVQPAVVDSQPSTSPQIDTPRSSNEESLSPNPLKRPRSEGSSGTEECRAARRHERYMINARIRLAEAEILLARINKGLVKE